MIVLPAYIFLRRVAGQLSEKPETKKAKMLAQKMIPNAMPITHRMSCAMAKFFMFTLVEVTASMMSTMKLIIGMAQAIITRRKEPILMGS